MAHLMFETTINFSCFFDTTQHSVYYACSQSEEYIFLCFSEINTEGGDCTLLCCKSVTRKYWKFEAVTNKAIVCSVFWGVQLRVVVTCCWAEHVGILFKTVGKCLKNYTTPNTLLYFNTAISNRLRTSNKITYLADTCLWWPELTDLELNSNYKLNSVASVRTRTIPTERPPPVGEDSANFCGERGVTWSAQRVPTAVNLCFLDLEPLLFSFK